MKNNDVLIIGAGACGLMAARELSRKGISVTILEARNRTGGRIYTMHDPAFELPVEAGAEFVHGNLGLTMELLRTAGAETYPISGNVFRYRNGQLKKQEDFIEDEDELIKKLKGLQEDMSVAAFLSTYFADEKHTELRESVTSFVQGYDAADTTEASCFALLEELLGEDGDQFRITNGYGKLVEFLTAECKNAGCNIQLSTVVSVISWRPGEVVVTTADKRTYVADVAIITLPVSVLQLSPGEDGYVKIDPLPRETRQAIHALGSTGVIKITLQFREAFWKDKDMGFLFSDMLVPAWWTQLPKNNGMITGWLAGPTAVRMKNADDDDILQEALSSLARMFNLELQHVKELLMASHIFNWARDPLTRGAYAYEKVTSKDAKKILSIPLDGTLFFAGEALHIGPRRGTVEGALQSGKDVAQLIK